jgi:peptidoglycan hydrolase CwlO-like protein|nr:MAG TPA: hypothetical protein [Caudoviricetes sp.]
MVISQKRGIYGIKNMTILETILAIALIISIFYNVGYRINKKSAHEADVRTFVMDKALLKEKVRSLEEEKILISAELEHYKKKFETYKENCKGLNKKIVELKSKIKNGRTN